MVHGSCAILISRDFVQDILNTWLTLLFVQCTLCARFYIVIFEFHRQYIRSLAFTCACIAISKKRNTTHTSITLLHAQTLHDICKSWLYAPLTPSGVAMWGNSWLNLHHLRLGRYSFCFCTRAFCRPLPKTNTKTKPRTIWNIKTTRKSFNKGSDGPQIGANACPILNKNLKQ